MSRILLDHDTDTGERLWLDEDSEGHMLVQEHDVAPVIEHNKALQNEGFDKSSEMWHAASIPIGIQYEWLDKYGVDFWNKNHKPAVMKLLNSNEYRYLRVNNFII